MSEFRRALTGAGRVPMLLMLYVLVQPVVDVLTSLAAEAKLAVTPGTVVRMGFLLCAALWLVLARPYAGKRRVLAYGGLVTAYFAAFLLWSLGQGGLALCLQNASEGLKVFYALYLGLLLYGLYRQRGFLLPMWVVAACGAGYCLVILLAFVTGTSFASYNAGYGYSGWFYSANDVSTILLLAAPVLLQLCMERVLAARRVRVELCVVLFSVLFSAVFLGTKLVYLGVLVYLLAVVVWYLVRFFAARDRALLRGLALALTLCAVMAVLYPISPLNAYMSDVFVPMSGEDEAAKEASLAIEGVKEADRAEKNAALEAAARGTWLGELVERYPLVNKLNWLLSRRLLYIAPILEEYLEAGAWGKLMGLGYGQTAFYSRDIHQLVEMEPVMLLLRHGVVGLCLVYGPVLAAVFLVLRRALRDLGAYLSDLRRCSLLYSALMAFAASLVVGHVLQAPSVSVLALAVYSRLLAGREAEG